MKMSVRVLMDDRPELAIDIVHDRFELDELACGPVPLGLTPYEVMAYEQRRERRQRFVDMVASQIAHALTTELVREPDEQDRINEVIQEAHQQPTKRGSR